MCFCVCLVCVCVRCACVSKMYPAVRSGDSDEAEEEKQTEKLRRHQGRLKENHKQPEQDNSTVWITRCEYTPTYTIRTLLELSF